MSRTRHRQAGRPVSGVRLVCAAALSAALLTACDSRVIGGSPVAPSRGPQHPVGSDSTAHHDLRAFCTALHQGAQAITRSHGDLHVVLHSFDRMNAVAPAAVGPDTSYVVNTLRHALASHQMPDLAVLGTHAHAVARWGAAHCDRI